MTSIYLASTNKGKIRDFQEYLSFYTLSIEVDEVQSMDAQYVIEKKVDAIVDSINIPRYKDSLILVEDTSLYLDALNGFPGPFVKFFQEGMGSTGIYNMAKKLKNYGATAVCQVGVISIQDTVRKAVYSHSVKGKIVSPKAKGEVFGWDDIFMPLSSKQTFAQMEIREKLNHTPRGYVIRKLAEALS